MRQACAEENSTEEVDVADFFDKVKQGINKGVTTVSVRSKEALDTTKLKTQIDMLHVQKKERIEELGNVVYVMHLRGGFDEERFRAKCREIEGVDGQIKDKEAEMAQVRARSEEALGRQMPLGVCECGAEVFDSRKFCGRCGKKIDFVMPDRNETRNNQQCSQCGQPLLLDAMFCNECGCAVPKTATRPVAPVPEQKTCPQCAAVLPLTAKFCKSCGTKT